MQKKLIACFLLMCVGMLVQAHEFWLQPQQYFFKAGETMNISFRIGENFMGEVWDLNRHRVEKMEHYFGAQQESVKALVNPGDKENVALVLKDEGTHLIALQSNDAFIELEADKFNAYLEEDGLDNVIAIREKNKATNKPGREFYTRHAKLLVQAGTTTDDTYKKVVGFPLEIVPLKNPYALKKGEHIRFKILWQGKPVFGVKVRVWNRADNRTTIQNIYTEQDGTIQTPISNKGAWMISVVKMEPVQNEKADWHSHWASLVYGVQ